MAKKSSALKTASPGALTQQVYDGLCQEITTGRLRPGATLSRRRIAARYGVSYTPVVEAFVRLEQTGLIEAETSQMARVRRVSLESIRSDFVLREAVETQAIRLACETATPQEIAELYGLATAVDSRAEGRRSASVSEGPQLHWEFHKRIAELSRYGVLVRELERIALLKIFRDTWLTPKAAEDPPRSHGLLVDAIKARDHQAADAEMRAHVRRGLENECLAYSLQMLND